MKRLMKSGLTKVPVWMFAASALLISADDFGGFGWYGWGFSGARRKPCGVRGSHFYPTGSNGCQDSSVEEAVGADSGGKGCARCKASSEGDGRAYAWPRCLSVSAHFVRYYRAERFNQCGRCHRRTDFSRRKSRRKPGRVEGYLGFFARGDAFQKWQTFGSGFGILVWRKFFSQCWCAFPARNGLSSRRGNAFAAAGERCFGRYASIPGGFADAYGTSVTWLPVWSR